MPTRTRKVKCQPSELLFPKFRRKIPAATLLHPDRWWYLSDLARALRAVPQALRRGLNQLGADGILQRRADGNRIYFNPDPDCSILHDLQRIFLETVGLVDVLRDALRPFAKKIACAFVYGSIARGEAISASDIGFMIIGNVRLFEIAAPRKDAEHGLFRPVNSTVYTAREYAEKLREGHSFIATVHNAEKLFVVGTEDDLESIASTKPGAET